MKRNKKIIGFFLTIILIGVWAVRYYSLNDGFAVSYFADREYFNMGDIVEYGDDVPIYTLSFKGYSIQVNNVEFYEPVEYAELYEHAEAVNKLSFPDKVVEVDVTFYNSDNETDGIEFYPIQLVGTDWFMTCNTELIAWANPIYENDADSAYGIILLPDSSYDIKLVYGLYNSTFPDYRWNDIENEKMWLEITIMPTNKQIKLF